MSGEVYPAFIEGELKTERERRVNLDGRGAAVVTQSGGLITLMAGVAAFVGNTAPDKLPPLGVMALILALLFFVGAAARGILVTYPPMYPSFPVANEATMKMMRDEKREHPNCPSTLEHTPCPRCTEPRTLALQVMPSAS